MILTWSTGHAAGPPVEGVAGGNPDEAVDESDCDESSEDPEFDLIDLIDLIDSTDVKTDEADVSVEATEATEATERRLYGLLTERREGALADEAEMFEAKSMSSWAGSPECACRGPWSPTAPASWAGGCRTR